MSEMHEPAMQRILESPDYDAVTISEIFEDMLEKAQENNPEVAQYIAMFIQPEDEFVVGTYVPEIWFILRKVVEDDAEHQAG
jgi:FPC/CPF motif-containing protein YcgG